MYNWVSWRVENGGIGPVWDGVVRHTFWMWVIQINEPQYGDGAPFSSKYNLVVVLYINVCFSEIRGASVVT